MECRITDCRHHDKTSCNPGYACPTYGKVHLDGSHYNKGHVFVFDENNKLRAKFWFYGDGNITYREWNEDGAQIDNLGEYSITKINTLRPTKNQEEEP